MVLSMALQMYGKAGSPISRYVYYMCYIWLDSKQQEECSSTKKIIHKLSMQKVLMQSVRPTQSEEIILYICTSDLTHAIPTKDAVVKLHLCLTYQSPHT